MPNSKEHKIDAFTAFLGFVLGYGLFAAFLLLYERVAAGGFDSDDFTIRMMTPFSLRLRWTDFVCYGLITLGISVIAKLQDQI
jgi:hypothetical protein